MLVLVRHLITLGAEAGSLGCRSDTWEFLHVSNSSRAYCARRSVYLGIKRGLQLSFLECLERVVFFLLACSVAVETSDGL